MDGVLPERTYAVLVGVERYAAGPGWDIDGPAADAARFASWLRSCQVPASQIFLLASALPANTDKLTATGLTVRPADRETVHTVLTRELRTRQSDLLFVYWGGHGVIDQDGRRLLFYADATEADKRNLDIDSLLRSLASEFFPYHPRQLLIVDACQGLADAERWTYRLPAEMFPAGRRRASGREQHLLLAASPGQRAANLDRSQTGVFTSAVLDELGEKWPPDGARLAESLDRRFRSGAGSDREHQNPFHIWLVRGPHDEGELQLGDPLGQRLVTEGVAELGTASLGKIVDVMLSVDDLVNPQTRRQLILEMPSEIRAAVPDLDGARPQLVALLRTCSRFPGGRAALIEVLDAVVADRPGLARVKAAVERYWPVGA